MNESNKFTLHEAMGAVLMEKEDRMLRASDLSDEIWSRKLYIKDNEEKAGKGQIRARAIRYPEIFEVIEGNYIKLL